MWSGPCESLITFFVSLVFGRSCGEDSTLSAPQSLLSTQDWLLTDLARRPSRLPASHRPFGAHCSLPSLLQDLVTSLPPPLMTGGGGGTSPAMPWSATCRSLRSQVMMLPIANEKFVWRGKSDLYFYAYDGQFTRF